MAIFTGSGVALITPFNEKGINFDALSGLIEYVICGGTSALIVLGTTGEPSTMTREEKESVVDFAVKKVNKRIPVIVGCGGNNTQEVVKNAQQMQKLKADGLLIVTPYYNKCTQKGAVLHYGAISDAVDIPIIVYNVPSRTGFNLLPQTVLEMTKFKNIRAVKEACGDVSQMIELARLTKGKLDLYSGDDLLTVPAMSVGFDGVISVASNVVPKNMSEIASLCQKGDFKTASKKLFEISPLIKTLFSEVNPIPCKKAMQLLSFDAGVPRLPLTEAENTTCERLKNDLKNLGLI